MNQLQIIENKQPEKPKRRGYIQEFKAKNKYRKNDFFWVRCEFCANCVRKFDEYSSNPRKVYYKCKNLGLSSSTKTDVRRSYVCNLWEGINQ